MIDTVIPAAEKNLLLEVGLGLAIASTIIAALSIASERMLLRIDGRTSILIEAALWDHVLRLPARTHRRYSSGDMETRLAGVDRVRNAIVSFVLSSTLTASFSVFYLALLFVYEARLALFAIFYVFVLTAR